MEVRLGRRAVGAANLAMALLCPRAIFGEMHRDAKTQERYARNVLFCFVLFSLQLSVCLWWHDYHRDVFPTLKFVVVIADLARHLLREEPFALSAAPTIWAGEPGHC